MATLNGIIIQLNEEIRIKKFDSYYEAKVDKLYRTSIRADDNGAFIALSWENLANEVCFLNLFVFYNKSLYINIL